MRPRIKVLTLGVDDLERSLAFYRDGLGLPTKGIVGTEFEDGAVVFINMNDDLVLALWPRTSLAKDAGLPVGPPSPADFSIGHNVGSREEVDAVMRQAELAGARIIWAAKEAFWGGYTGYFQDPDGHLWEVAWNPAWEVQD
jgi:catechol 2,3-dioxygenase-like lactoylglutathione lyase family enzyme